MAPAQRYWKRLPETETDNTGILACSVQSHCVDEAYYLYFQNPISPADPNVRYMKMKGRKVYEYAIKNVPLAMKACLEKCGCACNHVKKFFLHQANEKMDEGL
jgi:3-oxoacyl-[acyl-carrier-protein] synthase-3